MNFKLLLMATIIPFLSGNAFADDDFPMESNSKYSDKDHQEDRVDKGGLFLEPSITYLRGDTTVSYPAPFSSSKESVEGLGLGLRLGGHVYESLFVALDGRWARPQYDSSATGEKVSANAYNAGLTLGLQTPVAGLRVWGTYLFSGELDPDSMNNVDVKFKDLRGYRIGAGLYVAAVSINLEYQDAKYGSTELQDAGVFTGSTDDVTGKDRSYILSVSFPIAL